MVPAILAAGVWEAATLTHRQVIANRCRKEPEARPQKAVVDVFRFSSRTKAKRVAVRQHL